MLTGCELPPSLSDSIKGLPLAKRVHCVHCKLECYIPILWDTWWCEQCGEQSTLNLSGMVFGVVRDSLLWAKMDPDIVGLSFGDPKRLSHAIVERVTATFGRPLPFMGLRQKFNWECQHSGQCCADVVKYTCSSAGRMSPNESMALFGNPDQTQLPQKAGEVPTCGFHLNNRCAAYHVRPSFCRSYPLGIFSLEIGNKRVHYVVAAGVCCPGLGKGKTWVVKDYLKQVGILQRLTAYCTDGYTEGL